MKRRDLLKMAGVAGLASLVPSGLKTATAKPDSGSCVLIPSETAGPFPLDLTDNSFYFRQDVRESEQGVQLNLKLKILGLDNCLPMPNVRVNIWHCSAEGDYSGYNSEVGQTYLRGYQMTDVNGEVEFVTIFPGWYPGRVCHIHFQVYVSSMYAAISQLAFPDSEKDAIYSANPSLYPDGVDPVSIQSDGVFADGYAYQLATLTANSNGGYDSYMEVTVQGSGTTGLGALEPETGGQFKLGQNFPNPYIDETTIPFSLKSNSDVKLELFDLNARKVVEISRKNMEAGDNQIKLNLKEQGIARGNYVYQLEVSNQKGTYRQCKMMTAAR